MLLYLLQTQNCKVQNLVGLGDLHSEDLGRSFQHFCGQIHPCKTKALACTEADRFCGGEGRGGECRGGGGGGGAICMFIFPELNGVLTTEVLCGVSLSADTCHRLLTHATDC